MEHVNPYTEGLQNYETSIYMYMEKDVRAASEQSDTVIFRYKEIRDKDIKISQNVLLSKSSIH